MFRIWSILPALYCVYSSYCIVWHYIISIGCVISNLIRMCSTLIGAPIVIFDLTL